MKADAKNSDTGVAKQARRNKKGPSETHGQSRKRTQKSPEIAETEEAHALLEEQLHGLYWWIFNAYKLRGFIQEQGRHRLGVQDRKAPADGGQQAGPANPAGI